MTDSTGANALPSLDELERDLLASPGLHEAASDDPESDAARLAGELDGEWVTSTQLGAALDRRDGTSDDPVERLLTQRLHAQPHDQVREIADIDAMRALARSLAKADRILAGTHANMVETVGQRVSAGGIAVHPDSIRSAAKDLVAARAEVAKAEAELAEANAAIEATSTTDAADDSDATEEPEFEPVASSTGRDRSSSEKLPVSTKRRIAGVVVMAFGVAIVLGALLYVAVGAPALIVVVFPVVAIWWAFNEATIDLSDVDDKEVASDNLARISERTDDVFGVADLRDTTTGPIPASTAGKLRLAESRLDQARERERSAQYNWSDLVGPDSDPADVDRVLRERDPQYFAAIEQVGKTSQARAAAAHLRRVRARWNVAWAALDRGAPAAADAEDAVRILASNGVDAVRIVTRLGTDDDIAAAGAALDALGSVDPHRPLVLAGLADDLDDDLIDRLAQLADRAPVVVLSASS